MIRLTIDGQDVTVPEGTLVVDAAAQVGIDIPVYCYHGSLGSLGACRICLVEIEKMPKLATACTTVVSEGMVVHTKGPAVDKGRKGILEFLLINHPLDCPVCDKGGECYLQDYAFFYGAGKNRFEEAKLQKQKDYPVNDYILLDQERCVLCQRCVRFLGEYVGEPELMLEGRGVYTVVTRVADRPVRSPFAGNIIDLCPVGALLSEPYHHRARPWNIDAEPSVCLECPVGCPSTITGRDGRILRMEGRPTPGNWGWLCDTGRFTYDFGRHPDRLVESRLDGRPAPVAEVTRSVAERLKAVVDSAGPQAVAILTGGRLPVEDDAEIVRFAQDVVGTDRLALVRPVAGEAPIGLLGTFEDLDAADVVLLVGVDPYEAVPVVHLRLREAVRRRGLKTLAVGERGLLRDTLPGREWVAEPGRVAHALARALAAHDAGEAVRTVAQGLDAVAVGLDAEALRTLGEALLGAERLVVLWDGEDPEVAPVLSALAVARGERITRVLPTYGPPSGLAAYRVGIPTSYAAARDILAAARDGSVQCLILWGADPVRDFPDAALAEAALDACPTVVYAGWFPPEHPERYDAVLPTAAWGEVNGTYVNMEGRLQSARLAASAPGDARPASTLLRAIARHFGRPLKPADDWDPFAGQDGDRIARPAFEPAIRPLTVPAVPDGEGLVVLVGSAVAVDHLPSEVAARTPVTRPLRCHPAEVARIGLPAEGGPVALEADGVTYLAGVTPDPRIPEGRIFVPRGVPGVPWNRLAHARVAVKPRQEVAVP